MTRRRAPGPYLEHRTRLRVRFQDVDVLQVVWHGHYLGYFEAGREGLGDAYGLGFRELLAAGLVAPVVHASCDYLLPARYGDELVVVARLHASPRATVELTYEVRREADGALLARGRSVQVFTDPEGHLHLDQPDLLRRFWEQWGDQVREG